ncbi:MAG: SGNH/GDSL hydrolase family protein [Sedimenticola sp.]
MPYTTDSRDFDHLVSTARRPVRILAEGDSWFAYPRRFFAFGEASNIVQVLGKKKRYVIYTTASSGDEAVTMMSGDQKFAFTKRLKHTEFDVILFSGGGNDIVGKFDFDFFLRERSSAQAATGCIDMERLENKLSQIRSVYIELLERVEQYSKNPAVKVVTHAYDYVVPEDKGFELFDLFPIGESWLYPFLKNKGFDDGDEQREVVRFMLGRFRDEILALEADYPDRLFVANTQGLLEDKHWRNEIHPTPAGFRIISKAIDDRMKEAIG